MDRSSPVMRSGDGEAPAISRRWILVAGTGLEVGTPDADILAARAVGEELATHHYGLITGAWHGVDFTATESFVHQLRRLSLNPKDYLIQVIPDDRHVLHDLHRQGHIIRTPYGAREWLDPQRYADAVILIGGRGGTYRTWLGALHDGIPRLPFGGTQGDAHSAFRQTLDLWELIPVPGITRSEFSRLGQTISSASDARTVAQDLVGSLLWRCLDAIDAVSRKALTDRASLFISYSRTDSDWVTRLRTLLRPAERRGVISTWVDADINPGKPWEPQILARLNESQAALLLVSQSLLESRYVREVEMPALVQRMTRDHAFHLFWLLLKPCNWEDIPHLRAIQAIGSVSLAISQSATKADEQCRLIDVVATIVRALSSRNALETRGAWSPSDSNSP